MIAIIEKVLIDTNNFFFFVFFLKKKEIRLEEVSNKIKSKKIKLYNNVFFENEEKKELEFIHFKFFLNNILI